MTICVNVVERAEEAGVEGQGRVEEEQQERVEEEQQEIGEIINWRTSSRDRSTRRDGGK